MERITTLEQARLQRDMPLGDIHFKSPKFEEVPSTVESLGVTELSLDFTDTTKFRLPYIEISPSQRDRERILPPGAPGKIGAAYKMLRTQVLKRLDKLGVNTLAVMSAGPADGKTLTAINLAIAVAAVTDRSALLVDLDLRNPNIHRRFGFEPAVGIEECIDGPRAIQEAMVKISGYNQLTVLPASKRVEYSSELLGAQKTIDVMNEMRKRYANRVLIFDLPPVLQADDALTFSRIVQAGLIVVGEGKTKRGDVARAISLLSDLPIVGTVLNGSRDAPDSYY